MCIVDLLKFDENRRIDAIKAKDCQVRPVEKQAFAQEHVLS